jgi:hypothetical protein
VDQTSNDAAVKAVAFANGLRKSITTSGRRWAQWPGGANNLAAVVASIDGVGRRLHGGGEVAACIADLRAILEWTQYQSASVATARALVTARKTRAFAQRFGILDNPAARLSVLVDSEESLIENVRTKNAYMVAIAERHPDIALPRPLVAPESLVPAVEKKPGKLDLIAQLTKSAKKRK